MTVIALFALLVLGYGLVSVRIERVATAPLVFTLAGLAAPMLLPSLGDGEYLLVDFRWLAEIGLVLLLFTDATRTDLSLLRRIQALPARLLGPGMVLTLVLGALVALVVFEGMPLWEACILAAILAPTDAGLGQSIVQSPLVPAPVREALGVEAGLNDGLSVPFLLFFMAMVVAAGGDTDASLAVFMGQQLGLGILVGGAIGAAGGWLLRRAEESRRIVSAWVPRTVVVLPVLCLLASEEVGASMFIAAFVAGLSVRATFPRAGEHAVEFAEDWGQLFNLAVFFLFGLLVERVLGRLEPGFFLYAVLSLTVIRMLPVALALAGSGLDRATVLFVGWFGPRGLASIVLGLVFVEQEIHTVTETTIEGTVIVTVLLSILLHGLSARPGIALYGRRVAGLPPGALERKGEAAR